MLRSMKMTKEESKAKYYPKAYKRIFIQERDLDIFDYGLEQKFLTIDQIARRFFPSADEVKDKKQAGYKRILSLQKFDMVKLVPILTGERIVQITENGALELDKQGRDHLGALQSVDYRYFEHDRRVTECRILFEQLQLQNSWKCERELKKVYSNRTRVPDAMLTLPNGQSVALEVEIARKSKHRYQKIFGEYINHEFGNLDLVFYVCNTIKQIELLLEYTKEYSWIYYCHFEQLLKLREKTIFANYKDHFRLDDLCKIKMP